uniref:Programmed cell death protein 5 n=1 Tax=Anas platyrhynchos TaxID=8839 RepID=A0A8B9TGP0_ANAPL|nr:programmed cell death protein 5 isoform X3 [Anas platyrhynchos]|eukprot:XP_027322628.1 programmed cell death protein 5 isoform X3 [Anas platyrhynchos]
MADDELEALRRQRLAELQAKHGDSSADPSQQEAKQREAEIRNTILAQVLDQAARARLSNLALVKPDKAKAVENYLIQMARYGQLPGKITEQVLIEILEKASQQTEKTTTVKLWWQQTVCYAELSSSAQNLLHLFPHVSELYQLGNHLRNFRGSIRKQWIKRTRN